MHQIRSSGKPRTISGPSSVEPLSTMIISQSVNVCARTDWTVAAIYRPLSNRGVITETRGMAYLYSGHGFYIKTLYCSILWLDIQNSWQRTLMQVAVDSLAESHRLQYANQHLGIVEPEMTVCIIIRFADEFLAQGLQDVIVTVQRRTYPFIKSHISRDVGDRIAAEIWTTHAKNPIWG